MPERIILRRTVQNCQINGQQQEKPAEETKVDIIDEKPLKSPSTVESIAEVKIQKTFDLSLLDTERASTPHQVNNQRPNERFKVLEQFGQRECGA